LSFNPLHCGAVVASSTPGRRPGRPNDVSIPFIAGQWSLHPGAARRRARSAVFQSPSLRGSGRFRRWPLSGPGASRMFQSPSLRGSGRFTYSKTTRTCRASGFNPLHCGAVVASPKGGGRSVCNSTSFNPLHCGAVVASAVRLSLAWGVRVFQSPSLRGSGRFRPARRQSNGRSRFQSPSLRGSGRFCRGGARRRVRRRVSIPFIAGQWSLLVDAIGCWLDLVEFQSPSLRGSGRFERR